MSEPPSAEESEQVQQALRITADLPLAQALRLMLDCTLPAALAVAQQRLMQRPNLLRELREALYGTEPQARILALEQFVMAFVLPLEGGLEALRERAQVLGVGSLEPREGVGDAFADGLLDDVVEDAHAALMRLDPQLLPAVWLGLGSYFDLTGDGRQALDAYRKYLLASVPGDPQLAQVRQWVELLERIFEGGQP